MIRRRVARTVTFWRAHGSGAVARLVARKVGGLLVGRPLFNPLPSVAAVDVRPPGAARSVIEIENERFVNLRPLRTYRAQLPQRRLSMVTDSIGKGSLFGGVGTAILFAACLAERLDVRLRVITRTERPVPDNLRQVLQVYGLTLRHEPEFLHASVQDRQTEVDLLDDELVLTTSWWTTHAALAGVPASRIVYLLQEDERMFYPYGDDRLLCEDVLRREDLRFVINTHLLRDHLAASGLPHIGGRALCFEPAFPGGVFRRGPRQHGARKRLFFYARPNNLRNLFHLGIRVLDRAISQGVLRADEWEILLVGSGVPPIDFGEGVRVQRLEHLDWSAYASLCGSVDLALSLMYTPHPSYPPLDLAASGAVVVTNSFGNKQDLSAYSPLILCAPPQVDALVLALAEGVARVRAGVPVPPPTMPQNWQEVFGPVVAAIAEK